MSVPTTNDALGEELSSKNAVLNTGAGMTQVSLLLSLFSSIEKIAYKIEEGGKGKSEIEREKVN